MQKYIYSYINEIKQDIFFCTTVPLQLQVVLATGKGCVLIYTYINRERPRQVDNIVVAEIKEA